MYQFMAVMKMVVLVIVWERTVNATPTNREMSGLGGGQNSELKRREGLLTLPDTRGIVSDNNSFRWGNNSL